MLSWEISDVHVHMHMRMVIPKTLTVTVLGMTWPGLLPAHERGPGYLHASRRVLKALLTWLRTCKLQLHDERDEFCTGDARRMLQISRTGDGRAEGGSYESV